MATYSTGTVTVTNGSTTVTGSGTNWQGNLKVGWMFVGPDFLSIGIANIVSDTEITLTRPYQGSTQSDQTYEAFSTRSIDAALFAQLQQIATNFQALIDGPGNGLFQYGTAGAPGIAFESDPDTGLRRTQSNGIGLVGGGQDKFVAVGNEASGDVVQSSQLDTTAGRLLRQGAFGLGAISATTPVLSDLNAFDTPAGLYAIQTSTSGDRPTGASNFAFCFVLRQATTGIGQIYINSNGLLIAFRAATSSVWSDWSFLVGQHNLLGTVSQSSGVPTGAVIERGSNANGEYVRWADGTQICTHSLLFDSPVNTPDGSIFKTNTATVWTYPASFSQGAAVAGHNETVGSCWITPFGTGANTTSMFAHRAVANATPPTFALQAIGRWY